MRILITGALGHIGSGFIHHLVPGQFESVVLVDNLLTQRYCSLFDLPEGVPFRFVEANILETNLDALFDGMDTVIHLAAITDAAGSFGRKDEVEHVNCHGAEIVAEACCRRGCRMIFLSTTSVYGVQDDLVDENCSLQQLRPQSPYARSKLDAEQRIGDLVSQKQLRASIFRFGTIFGISAGMRFHTAVNKFVWQACQGLPLTVWRSAMNQKRPYLELGDAVAALRFSLAHPDETLGLFNVVTLNTSVSTIVETIREFIPDTTTTLVDSPIMNQLSYEVSAHRFESLGFDFHGDLHKEIGRSIHRLRGLRPENGR